MVIVAIKDSKGKQVARGGTGERRAITKPMSEVQQNQICTVLITTLYYELDNAAANSHQ